MKKKTNSDHIKTLGQIPNMYNFQYVTNMLAWEIVLSTE